MENEYESPLSELYLIDRKHVIEDACKRIKFDKYFNFLIRFCNLIPDDNEVMEILFEQNRRDNHYLHNDDYNCLNPDKAYSYPTNLSSLALGFLEDAFYNELIEEILTVTESLKFKENKKNYLQSIFDNLRLYYQFLFNDLKRLADNHAKHNTSLHFEQEPISTFIELYETNPETDKITKGEHLILLTTHIYNHLQKVINLVHHELESISGRLFMSDSEALPNSHKLIILHKLGLFEPLIKIKHEHNLSTNDFTKLVGGILGIHEKAGLNSFRSALSSFDNELTITNYPLDVLRPKAKKQTDEYLKKLGLNISKLKNKLP